ncbi:MAG: FAD-binding oxidoreductase [Methylococcaceae bacterium]|jgi:glycine/D-amino acid oxidase-like deaminating enzyme
MIVDVLIVGQGLAGSFLGWELLQLGHKILVVDSGQQNASQIAAGLINPITGQRFVKSFQVDQLLPTAIASFQKLEAFFGQTFYRNKTMLRLFQSALEQTHCQTRKQDTQYADYLGEISLTNFAIDPFKAPYGYAQQKHTGYLLTLPLLACLKQFLIAHNSYRLAEFDYAKLQTKTGISWLDVTAQHIIFCEGYKVQQNPWFSWLPFQMAKGEILTLKNLSPLPDYLFNYGHWLIPLTEGTARTGATFDNTDLNLNISHTARDTLLQALNKAAPGLSHSVLAQDCGLRPCTLDKQPILGAHPQHANILIFNGFGTKGSLQIPWHSQRMIEHLCQQLPLPSSCDINRYASHFPA